MEKLDLVKKDKAYYTAGTTPQLLELPEIPYLSITGKGDPSSAAFAQKIEALYPVAYGVKFLCKAQGKDFSVPKLEGLWWYDDRFNNIPMQETPVRIPREEWHWRLLIRMPDFVTPALMQEAITNAISKKKSPFCGDVEFFRLHERKVVQVMHIGPFDKEPETLQKVLAFCQQQNLQKAGHHHEIYLSDFRKTPAARLKTILREPVAP